MDNFDRIINVLSNELKCVERQFGNVCDNKRDYVNCDLALNDKEIIFAYENAIHLIETVEDLRQQIIVKDKLIKSLDKSYKTAKSCGELETIQDLMKFCRCKLRSDDYTNEYKSGVQSVLDYLEYLSNTF